MAEAAGHDKIGEERWAAMTAPQRALSVKSYTANCHGHLRNIVIKAMVGAAVDFLKAELQDDLLEFGAYERVSVEPYDVFNAFYKLLHKGAEYANGKQREFWAVVETEHPSTLVLPFANTHGERQDIKLEGWEPILINRLVVLSFLKPIVNVPGKKDDSKLDRFCYICLRSNPLTALARVSTLFQNVLFAPHRCLAGKGAKLDNWSVSKMDELLDTMASTLGSVAADGDALFDAELDPYAPLAETQPLFATWREQRSTKVTKAADGTPHLHHVVALAEARAPTGAGGAQSQPMAVRLAELMAKAGIKAMRDPKRAIAELLTQEDGSGPTVGDRAERHEALKGANVTNDPVERIFGKYDIVSHQFRYATAENLAGMAQQMNNQDFERPPNVQYKAGKENAPPREHVGGFYHNGLNQRCQQSLVEFSRLAAPKARADGRLALVAHDQHKLAKREDRLEKLLKMAVELHAESMELFAAWEATRAITRPAVEAAIKNKPEVQQLEYLRRQIDMRTKGLGWTQFATRWSSCSDASIGTVAHLKALLLDEIIPEERKQERLKMLPTEAQPPHLTSRDLPTLGEIDEDALAIEQKSLFSAEELKRKAELECKRREAAGIWDNVEALNPDEAPPFHIELVGKEFEVLWKYFNKDTKEPQLIWTGMRCARVADGLTDKRSKLARTLLPAGALLMQWDADPEFEEQAGEQWLILLPKKWKKQQHYSWRYAPAELARMRGMNAAEVPERPRATERANMRAERAPEL